MNVWQSVTAHYLWRESPMKFEIKITHFRWKTVCLPRASIHVATFFFLWQIKNCVFVRLFVEKFTLGNTVYYVTEKNVDLNGRVDKAFCECVCVCSSFSAICSTLPMNRYALRSKVKQTHIWTTMRTLAARQLWRFAKETGLCLRFDSHTQYTYMCVDDEPRLLSSEICEPKTMWESTNTHSHFNSHEYERSTRIDWTKKGE